VDPPQKANEEVYDVPKEVAFSVENPGLCRRLTELISIF
jgi:hypothetical protein